MMMLDPRTSYYRSRRAFDILIVIVGIFINRVLKAPGSHYRYTYIFRIANTLFCVEDDDERYMVHCCTAEHMPSHPLLH